MIKIPILLSLAIAILASSTAVAEEMDVFVFAGQSNMEGADSKVADVDRFPPFRGVTDPRKDVRFWHVIGREDKADSKGWVPLQPVRGMVGPELVFVRDVMKHAKNDVAIVKIAAGGTHLGGDWNPDEPSGFKMYPLLVDTVRSAMADLERQGFEPELKGFFWHQGENDMFEEAYLQSYGENLANLMKRVRADLDTPSLPFYVGELCTKTIWGMDLRPRMADVARGQRAVTDVDPLARYVPTSHVGVEIGGGQGLHYHYGTLGQLEHGANYAAAYLADQGIEPPGRPGMERWPYSRTREVDLWILAGHRNMEGERAFVQELVDLEGGKALARPQRIPYRYSTGGGVHASAGWEPLAPAGLYDTFGPEVSFGARMQRNDRRQPIAIAKFTHSGSQIVDWTPEGSVAKARNLYPAFLAFVRESMDAIRESGARPRLAGVVYHVGENDMSFHPFRRQAAERLGTTIARLRTDLQEPALRWFISQQPPTDHESVNSVDVVADMARLAAGDPNVHHRLVTGFPEQRKQLVLDTGAVVWLGNEWADWIAGVDDR
ncbi:MAG: sialate O-acetylesterase [Phycisphaera sp.]|nr:sialate O-acetylesterase [Phycisphaera sp.]